MRVNHPPNGRIRYELLALAPIVLLACATGVDPVRLGMGGAGAGTSSSTTGLGGEPTGPTSSTGGAPTTTTASSTNTSTTTTAASSTASTSSTTTATSSSTTTSASSSSGTPVMGLELQYKCDATATTVQEMKPWFQIINNGTAAVALSSLTIRYYYTKDGMPHTDQTFDCDFAALGCNALSFAFTTVTGTNADEYAEIAFAASAGSLAVGSNTGEIQARIHSTDYQYMLNQANDYSFDPTKTAFTDWTNITLYQNGTLVWGTEP